MERSTKQKVIEVLESNDSFIIALATPGESEGDVGVLFSASMHAPKFYIWAYLDAMIKELEKKREALFMDLSQDLTEILKKEKKNEK